MKITIEIGNHPSKQQLQNLKIIIDSLLDQLEREQKSKNLVIHEDQVKPKKIVPHKVFEQVRKVYNAISIKRSESWIYTKIHDGSLPYKMVQTKTGRLSYGVNKQDVIALYKKSNHK